MKNFKKISTILFLSAYLIIGFNFAGPVLAAAEVKFTPQIGIPGSEFQQGVSTTIGHTVGATTTSDLLARYVKAFYSWGLLIVGVLAVLMLMAGGLIWLTSAGDSGSIANAKKMIGGSLLGTLLLLGAYFFLASINPNLAKLPVIKMETIASKSLNIGCCSDGSLSRMTSESSCKGTFFIDKILNPEVRKCDNKTCCVNSVRKDGKDLYYCFDAAASFCTQDKENKACSLVSKCKSYTLSCGGIGNGQTAEGAIDGMSQAFYCYNETIYPSTGKDGEPCGTYSKFPYSGFCQIDSLPCYDKNNFGGRGCDIGLTCCLKQYENGGATGGWE